MFPGGKGGRCVGLTTLPPSCADCLNLLEPSEPVQALMGLLYLYLLGSGRLSASPLLLGSGQLSASPVRRPSGDTSLGVKCVLEVDLSPAFPHCYTVLSESRCAPI
jgi:hypothetical protein